MVCGVGRAPGAQNLYEESLKHGMAHIGTFSFGRVNNIWVIGYPGTKLENYFQKNMLFKE
jgi:hypothetical protein